MNHSSVVRIYATAQDPDYDSPWQARVPTSSTGSGVVVGDRRILTGAHVVANSTFLQVQKISDPDKAVATVIGICHDCDLALLEVESPGFMTGVQVAELCELPKLRDRVAVVGFPVGGEEVSITEGVVSRIEVQRYSHSQRHLLAVTVDAAINRGNSGGPVFSLDGKVAGIAFQKLNSAENIGEMVPPPIIENFLTNVEAGERVIEIPALGVATQGMENPVLRRRVGLTDDESGILVLTIEYGSTAWGTLEPGDAILRIDGLPIANNSTIQFLGRYRTRYDVILGFKRVGQALELDILRAGKRMTVSVDLAPAVHLVPRSQYDSQPTYFVYGGLVFQTLNRDFLATWDTWWEKAPKEFLHYYYSGMRTPDRHEIVILTQILADQLNVGYEHLYSEAVLAVDGEPVRDMVDFVAKIDRASGLIEIKMSSDGLIVLDAAEVAAAKTRIMKRYRISRDRTS